jgi:hypothetical protein
VVLFRGSGFLALAADQQSRYPITSFLVFDAKLEK